MVLVCAADTDGNVVSFIDSRFMGFGSGIVSGDTGIGLQNRGRRSRWIRPTRTVLIPGSARSTPSCPA